MKCFKFFLWISHFFTDDIVVNPFHQIYLAGLGEFDHDGYSDDDEYQMADFLYEDYLGL